MKDTYLRTCDVKMVVAKGKSSFFFISGQLESIELTLSYYVLHTCGGKQIFIEIIHGNRKCETLPKNGYAGETIIWDYGQLGSCIGEKFDTNVPNIRFRTLTKGSDGFCPLRLKVKFSDQIIYESGEMDIWNDQNEHMAPQP